MPINIHGKQYVTVAERLDMAREALVSLACEVVGDTPEAVTVKVTVLLSDGRQFQGHAASRKTAQGIEGQAPLEVAETSAVGRALGFAGYGAVDSIASADEVIVAQARPSALPPVAPLDAGDAPDCNECGRVTVYKSGVSQKGNPYKGWFCPEKDCKGKPVWIDDRKPLSELAPDSEEVPFS